MGGELVQQLYRIEKKTFWERVEKVGIK